MKLRAIFSCLVCIIALVCETDVSAGESAIGVVYHGPTEKISLFDSTLSDSGDISIPADNSVAVTDALFTPDGGVLASTKSNGLIEWHRTRSNTSETFELDDGATDLAVEAYDRRGRPLRLWVGYRKQGRLELYSTEQKRALWSREFLISEVPLRIVDVAAVSQTRVAVAMKRSGPGLSVVDIYEFEQGYPDYEGVELTARLTNRPALFRQLQVPVEGVSELSPVRALFVDADGRLVVAGDRHILRFRPSNGVEKTHALSDFEKVFGEIRTMAPRESGGLVVGLMEPGVWTEPHQNHEVLAFSSTSGELEISSRTEFVEAAPAAVRFLDGRAATGRLGYQPGVDTASRPDLELRVDSLSSEFVSYRPTMKIRLSISIENTTSRTGTLSRLDVRAKRSGCPSKNSGRVLWRLRSLRLKAGGSRRLSDTIETDSPLEDGEWCVKIELEYISGEIRQFGKTSYFRVSDPSGGKAVDAGADVKELGGPVYADTGSWPNGGSKPESGCGCGTSGADESPQMLIWMLVLGFLCRGHRLFPALKSGFDCSRDR